MNTPNTKAELSKTKITPAAGVGLLLGFYRRRQTLSQAELAAKVDVTASSIATFESGQRLPSEDLLRKIADVLAISPFAFHQLEVLSRGSVRFPADDWILPEDVASGTPIFLRDLESETIVQADTPISEMWIVTARPLALSGGMNTMLRDRIRDTKTTFVYFIDSGGGASSFRTLWEVLSNDAELQKAKITRDMIWQRLICVLSPASLCLQHFAICNPGQFGQEFGRIIVYSDGKPIGYTFMDRQHVTRAYNLLQESLARCKSNPGNAVDTEYGRFELVDPSKSV
jgi:transcriptional regulator with XRE-family HTH domain